LDILSAEEKNELLDMLNNVDASYSLDNTIVELLERQVERSPDRIAVVAASERNAGCENRDREPFHLTYRELNIRANRLAHFLREKGVKAGTIVGIMMERSLEMLVAVAAILKAGGCYLPIEPAFPAERVSLMLEDCGASLLLTFGGVIDDYSFTMLQGLQAEKAVPHLTAPGQRITDFDSLGFPDRSLVNYEKYNRYIGQALVKNRIIIQASRGCPHDCLYCYRIWPRKQVARSAGNIFNEIMVYYKMGIRRFDIFMLNIKEGRKLFQLIIDNKIDDLQLFFPNGFRGDLLSKEYIDLMVEAGTVNFALALETASPRLQKLINKHLHLERFRENAEYICKKYPHVIFELFTMHGIPSETEEEALENLEFIKSLKWIHFPYVNVLKIYSNTGMEKLAIEHGISRESILKSENLPWHVWSDTLPFKKEFTARYQADFLDDYVLSRERLLSVLPHQMNIMTEDELVQKYDSYLPADIKCFDDILKCARIRGDELTAVRFRDEKEDETVLKHLNERIETNFPSSSPSKDALRVLLLDLSQFFSGQDDMLYDVVDAPLGLMYLLTYLKSQLGEAVSGRILKSRIDFDSPGELRRQLEEFQPGIIGIRTLSYYKDFFHEIIAWIRQWGFDVPIIAGGPYATVEYNTMLQDRNIDLAVLGEGELTFHRLTEQIIANNGKLPGHETLKQIPGLAFIPRDRELQGSLSREIIFMDELSDRFLDTPGTNPAPINRPGDLAYIIYTSGSTGKPKGVPIEHRNAINVLKWFGGTYGLQGDTRVIQLTNYTFDPSVEQIFGTLLHGARLYMPWKDLAGDKSEFRRYIEQNQVNIINFVPGMLNELLGTGEKLGSLQAVISGGEKLDEPIKKRILEKGYRLYNQYGPTETTIDALAGECSGRRVTVGFPIANASCYILDNHGRLLPIGVRGELYIGGAGVARGYLNNPELTAEKFVPDPFSGSGGVLYRTGDFVRLHPGMGLEFLGRSDQQVKIRGYRIELGEIESLLTAYKNIKQAVVTVMRSEAPGGNYLCAYFVSDDALSPAELREYLAKKLPAYMIPAHFIAMEKMPETHSGKVDRNALPMPGEVVKEKLSTPRDSMEKQLAAIWAEVLGIEKDRIGINHNFFELGGHSLKVTVLIFKIHKAFNVKISLVEIFNILTIEELARYIKEKTADEFTAIDLVEGKEYYPLSSAQKRLYFLQQIDRTGTAYNVPQVVILEGRLNEKQLEKAFAGLTQRHESLRTSFIVVNAAPVQRIHHRLEFNVDYDDAAEGEIETRVERFARPFDLSQAPCLRVGLLKVGELRNILMVDMHHIITDGVSMNIFVNELVALYSDKELQPLTLQYKDFSQWQKGLLESGELKKQEAYWLGLYEDNIPVLNLPTDFDRPPVQDFEGDMVRVELSPSKVAALKKYVIEHDVTLFMTLLAVFNVLLAKICGQDEIVVGTATSGRRHADLECVIGMFVNTLALKNHPSGNKTFKEFLMELKQHTLEAFDNQDYQLEELVERVVVNRDSSRNPLFDVIFALPNLQPTANQGPGIDSTGLRAIPYDYKKSTAKVDMTFTVVESDDQMILQVMYARKLFKETTIRRIINYFDNILVTILRDSSVKISGIEIMSAEEKERVAEKMKNERKKSISAAAEQKMEAEFDF
jgi:amino acid adenylation domain-containing protein